MHVLVRHGGRIGRELANDLLEDVLQGHEPLDIAVLIHHEGEPAPVALKVRELDCEGGSLRHEVWLAAARDLKQPLAGQGIACQLLGHALHVQNADEVVELAVEDRQPRVRSEAQLIENVLPAFGHVDTADLLPGDHDVVHRHLAEIKDREQHLAVTGGHHRSGFGHDNPQLLGTEAMRIAGGAHDAEEAQKAVRGAARQPQDRTSAHHECAVDIGRAQRHRLGMRRPEDLRCELAENDHHDGERDAGQRQCEVQVGSLRDDRRGLRGKYARGRENHQIHAEPVIGPLQQPLEHFGGAVTDLCPVPDPVAVHRKQRHLGAGGERDHCEQAKEQQKEHGGRCLAQGVSPSAGGYDGPGTARHYNRVIFPAVRAEPCSMV